MNHIQAHAEIAEDCQPHCAIAIVIAPACTAENEHVGAPAPGEPIDRAFAVVDGVGGNAADRFRGCAAGDHVGSVGGGSHPGFLDLNGECRGQGCGAGRIGEETQAEAFIGIGEGVGHRGAQQGEATVGAEHAAAAEQAITEIAAADAVAAEAPVDRGVRRHVGGGQTKVHALALQDAAGRLAGAVGGCIGEIVHRKL